MVRFDPVVCGDGHVRRMSLCRGAWILVWFLWRRPPHTSKHGVDRRFVGPWWDVGQDVVDVSTAGGGQEPKQLPFPPAALADRGKRVTTEDGRLTTAGPVSGFEKGNPESIDVSC